MTKACIAVLLLTCAGCHDSGAFKAESATWRVTERIDKHEDKQGNYVEGNRPYDHNAVYLAMTHGKVRIYGRCRDVCDMRPGQDYECTTRANGIEALPPIPRADLICRNSMGQSVFVHALSQQ
jgi:hypothetical protein